MSLPQTRTVGAVGQESRASSTAESRSVPWSGVALVGVGVLFIVMVNAFMTVHLPFSGDEVDYLTKVNPSTPALFWTPVRAWGVPVLAAPVALFSPGEAVIRLYMSLVFGTGLVAAFWTWRRVVHPVVPPLACLLFVTAFTTTLYGNGVMPNLAVAIAAVAATGFVARLSVTSRRGWTLAGVTIAFAALAFLRPTDSLLVVGAVLFVTLLSPGRRSKGTFVAVIVGDALGWVPWLIESFITFGGPWARLQAGSQTGINGLHLGISMFGVYPRLFQGMGIYCCYGGPASQAGPISGPVVAWFVAIPVVVAIGLVLAARRRELTDIGTAALGAAAFVFFYFVLLDYGSPRFLLPILALLSLPIAYALVAAVMAARGPARVWAAAVCLAVVGAHLALNVTYDVNKHSGILAARRVDLDRAIALRPTLARKPCLYGAPNPKVTAYYLHCHAAVARPSLGIAPPAYLLAAEERGWDIVVIKPGPHHPPGSYLSGWRHRWIYPRSGRPFVAFYSPTDLVGPRPVG
jgi:hypothetical protein